MTAPDPTTPRCPTCGDVVPTTTGMECIGGKHIWHGGHTESLEVGEVRQFSDPRPADVPDPLGLEVGGTERHEWSAEVHADVLVSALRVERDAAQAELAQAREALRGWLELHSRRHMQADIFRMSDKTHRALADGEAPMEVHACPKCLHAYHPDGHCLHVVASTPPIFCGCLADGEERE